jgi:hypothetical protein
MSIQISYHARTNGCWSSCVDRHSLQPQIRRQRRNNQIQQNKPFAGQHPTCHNRIPGEPRGFHAFRGLTTDDPVQMRQTPTTRQDRARTLLNRTEQGATETGERAGQGREGILLVSLPLLFFAPREVRWRWDEIRRRHARAMGG